MKLKFISFSLLSLVLVSALPAVASGTDSEPVGIYSKGQQSGHYLQWNGKPILPVGDSVTQGWMELGTNFKQKDYVDALAENGINLLMIWSYIGTNAERQKKDARIGYDAPEIWPWHGSPDKRNFDLLKFNRSYFDRLKSLVAYAEKKQIIVLITVHDGWTKGRFAMHPFNANLGNGPLTDKKQYIELADYSNEMPIKFNPHWNRNQKNQFFQERFCEKLIEALNPYSNVIYEMFNEGEWYKKKFRKKHEQRFLQFFRHRTKNLLLTNTDHIKGDDPHEDPKVDIISLHGSWKNRFFDFQKGFNAKPKKPYLMSEPVPEFQGEGNLLNSLRGLLFNVAIAGAGIAVQNDTSFGWDAHAAISKRFHKRDTAYEYIGHCAKLFNESGVKFWSLKPNSRISDTGISSANIGKEYLIYAPNGGPIHVNFLSDIGIGRASVRFYNPRTGVFEFETVEKLDRYGRFNAPDSNDWVLHIKKADK